jgi:hypothetical protein
MMQMEAPCTVEAQVAMEWRAVVSAKAPMELERVKEASELLPLVVVPTQP